LATIVNTLVLGRQFPQYKFTYLLIATTSCDSLTNECKFFVFVHLVCQLQLHYLDKCDKIDKKFYRKTNKTDHFASMN